MNETSIPDPRYMGQKHVQLKSKREWLDSSQLYGNLNSLIRLSKPHVHIVQATKVSSTLKLMHQVSMFLFAVNIKVWDLFQLTEDMTQTTAERTDPNGQDKV